MRILRIGDPHIRPGNIEEADRLMAFVKECIIGSRKGKPIERLEILGDLFHTHAIVRIEVLDFWNKWLQIFGSIVETVVLVGNHDQNGDKHASTHSLRVFKHLMAENNLKIVDVPLIYGIYGYLPYIHDNEQFIKSAKYLKEMGAKTLVCHATFSGSQYDNGFYAPEGINPDDIPFDTIISGHIHKEQIIANGKVDYPGTPKWDTASDANEKKGIWLYQHDENGKVIERHMISTANICTPIVSFTWNEGEEAPLIKEGVKATVELVGSSDWIKQKKATLKGKVSISSKFTDKKRGVNRKTGNNLENYLANLYITTMDRTSLIQYAKELGIV